MEEDQPERLNVETAQPSLNKEGGLFGKSAAVSGSGSPIEESERTRDEGAASRGEDGVNDSNTKGDHQDKGETDATNGDANENAHGDDEEMTVDEAAEVKEEKPVVDGKTPNESVEEPEKKESKESEDAIDDIEMADLVIVEEEEEEARESPEKEEAESSDAIEPIDEARKEEKESPVKIEMDEAAVDEEKKEVKEVKKEIFSDDEQTEEPPAEGKTDESSMEEVKAEEEDVLEIPETGDELTSSDDDQMIIDESAGDEEEASLDDATAPAEPKKNESSDATECIDVPDESGKKEKESPEKMEKDENAAEEEKKKEKVEKAEEKEAGAKAEESLMEQEKAEEEEQAPVVDTPKRRRGRPPKSKSGLKVSVKKDCEEEKMDSDEEEEEVAKRGRGRGRKNGGVDKASKKADKGKGKEESESETDEEDEAVDSTPAVARKGRGRPAASAGRKRKAGSPAATSSSSKRLTTNVDIPELDAEAQWAVDHPADESAHLMPGARVFAAFQKVFYPALVAERDSLGRYLVEFVEDKIVRPVPPAGVVPLSAVTIDKECLFQPSADEDPVDCTVLRSANAASAKEWQKGVFELIDEEGQEHEAMWTQLQLNLATPEWKKYVNVMTKKVTKISTENITSVSEKRDRRSRAYCDFNQDITTVRFSPEPPSRRSSSSRKTPSASASAKFTPKTPDTGLGRGRRPKDRMAAGAAAAEEHEKEKKEEAVAAKKKKKNEEVEKKREKEADENAAPTKELGMIRAIFHKKVFLLTTANHSAAEVGFRKNGLSKQIVERGGAVVNDISEVPKDAEEAYLISDTHWRTYKYLAAMCRGIRCVSHKWLVECVQREQLLPFDNYKLAGGQGLIDDHLYPQPDIKGKLLLGRAIMVHSKTDSQADPGKKGFMAMWCPIVELLGAKLVCVFDYAWNSASHVADFPDFDILITDTTCSPEIVEKLEKASKTVVTSEWLIQSIIAGRCLDFKAHHHFRVNFEKTEGSQEQPTTSSQE